MSYSKGQVIDRKYEVEGLCSDTGGMGTVLFVRSLKKKWPFQLVLKYCKDTTDETLLRFRREVRLLASLSGDPAVVQVVDHNVDHDPPYFVMKFYADGDLSRRSQALQHSLEGQEKTFVAMTQCIGALHARHTFHRDIKPQNFLIDGEAIVVSDFGLTTEIGSNTAFTRSSVYWGTHGYIPPEFLQGGFKHADAAGDIFMLGKMMYVLLTGRDPLYLIPAGLPAPLLSVIERCCQIDKTQRYQSAAELQSAIEAAFDVLLGRTGSLGKARDLFARVQHAWERGATVDNSTLGTFIEAWSMLEDEQQDELSKELPGEMFRAMTSNAMHRRLPLFLATYTKMVERQSYGWSYAEVIAQNMRVIFDGDSVPIPSKIIALESAANAATYMHRFAAMDMCRDMVQSVRDKDLGMSVASLILKHRDGFLADTEPGKCRNASIVHALERIKSERDARSKASSADDSLEW